MIYEFLREQLETLDGLTGGVYPGGVCVDEVKAPFAMYTFQSTEAEKDLGGMIHHWTDSIFVDFCAETYDQVHALWWAAAHRLGAVSNLDTGHGEYIFSISCTAPEADGGDQDLALMRKGMLVTILWCELNE